MGKVFLGVDCGATHMRVGLIDAEGKVLTFHKGGSPLASNPNFFAKAVKEVTSKLLDEVGFTQTVITGIGIGVAGQIDIKKGEILEEHNISQGEKIQVISQFEQEYESLPLAFDRDANVALLGESWVGGARGLQDVVMMTLGTGVGGSIMIEGSIYHGIRDLAGEIGHMIIGSQYIHNETEYVPYCNWNHKGCLEAYVKSAKSLSELSYYVGIGLANVVDIFNPEKIIISGGLLKQGDILPEAVKVMRQNALKSPLENVIVEYSKDKDLIGMIGAARLIMKKLEAEEGLATS